MREEKIAIVASKAALEIIQPEELVNTAVDALMRGLDSPSLRILAGLNNSELDEAPLLFKRAIKELNLSMPSKHDAVMLLSKECAKNILSGETTPYEGARQIWKLTLLIPEEYKSELDTFIYGASEWEDRPEDRNVFENGILEAARDLLQDE